MSQFLRALPKAELHVHLEGSVPAELAVKLAARNGTPLPTSDPARLYRTWAGLADFLVTYEAVCAAIVTPADMAEVAYEAQAQAARLGNVRYREIFFNPTNHPSMTYRQQLEAVLDGLASAETDFGIVGRLIPAINRSQPVSVANDLVREVIAHRRDEVLGIGLDHDDSVGPAPLFAEAFALAARNGLRRTAHAAEAHTPGQITDSLDVLGCDRIDHGYLALADAAITARLRDEGTHVTTCWGTCCAHNPGRSQADQPIVEMTAASLNISINSDDPPMLGTDLGSEFVAAGLAMGWTREQGIAMSLAALDGAWLDDSDRAALRRSFEAEIAAL
ncbi:adenosine deaminase [Streptomyces sp. NPDC047081]|uniref:adenosine deaminase n=1 Tax=Streptomyces sp. NPDC047081 TaxID=3154706 RepID=UPI0033C0CB18